MSMYIQFTTQFNSFYKGMIEYSTIAIELIETDAKEPCSLVQNFAESLQQASTLIAKMVVSAAWGDTIQFIQEKKKH